MKEIKTTCTKGTVIRLGNKKREILDKMIKILLEEGFEEISIPVLQEKEMFLQAGKENKKMMYGVIDQGNRDLVLAPEYTAVIMELAKTTFKQQKDVKVFYVQECFRGEKPQAGRYRQFTQLGVEVINPTKKYEQYLISLARILIHCIGPHYPSEVVENTQRGLDYYDKGMGFELKNSQLGAQQQIVGGGSYLGGIGFAIGIDRLILLT